MHKSPEEVPWSLYWAQNRLHSCVATAADSDQKSLDRVWSDFSKQLPANARVLDLACGNGAVAAALLSAQPKLSIEAVDQADIDPKQFLSEHAEFERVVFHANTDINHLDFEADSFDALTSQFGIEYAGLFDATASALKHLRSGGQLCFVIHHKQSELVKSSQLKLLEMRQLLQDGGLIECLLSVLRGELDFSILETLGADYLADDEMPRTEQISGQVFKAINQIAATMQSNLGDAKNLGATLKLRLDSECQRLAQMDGSAQDDQQMKQLQAVLQQHGMEVSTVKTLFADAAEDSQAKQYLLGWLLHASKS